MTRSIVAPPPGRWWVLKGVSSVAALALVVVGVPIGLIEIGGVPFSHPGVVAITGSLSTSHAADSGLVARWIGGCALVMAWLVWVWMTICVATEFRTWSTGRTQARFPASRTLHSVAACLVGTALALSAVGRGATTSRPRAGVASAPLRLPGATDRPADRPARGGDVVTMDDLVAVSDLLANGSRLVRGASRPDRANAPDDQEPALESLRRSSPRSPLGTSDPPCVPRTHLVRSRQTLWSIAEEELGSALRWHELAELNYGIRQADGHSLDEGHWVRPGWRLLLPPTGRGQEGHGVQRTAAPDGGSVTGPGQYLPPTRDEGRQALVRSPSAPPVPVPPLPSFVPPPPTAPVVPSSPTAPVVPLPRFPTAPVVPLGGGVVGDGVVRLLDRMRRVQQRHRTEGSYIRLPDRVRRTFEQRLRVGDGWSVTREVDLALCQIGASAPTSAAPLIKGIRIHDEVIELIVVDPVASDRLDQGPPGGDGQRVMLVDRGTLLSPPAPPDASQAPGPPPARGPRSAAPMLVTVGRGPSGPVMVNLESLGSLVVTGNPVDADAVVRALALELSTSYWAGQFSVAVVGFGSELERFEGVSSYPDVATLIHLLCRRRVRGASHLRSTGFTSFAHARQEQDSDRWAPMVVICGPEVAEDDVAELLEVGADPVHGTAVVAVGERVEAQYSVRLTGGDWSASLELLGDAVFPQRVGPEELHDVTALLDTAGNRQSVLSSEEPYVTMPIRLPGAVRGDPPPLLPSGPTLPHGPENRSVSPDAVPAPSGAPVEESAVDVEVSVLGPIEIRGAARAFTRAWAEELVVYLAMHRNGASNEAWATALWPDRLMAPSSLHSTASVARRSLGQSADGTDHLPRSHGRLALSPSVGTDWDRFVALAGSDRPERWREALALVRGRPFEGLRSSDWPILEGIAPAIESAVVDLSGRLAGANLRQGDPQGAEWAARRGLVVSPYDERLYRMLMRAAELGGNPAGVDAVMSELLTLVADGIEPLEAVHPSTMDLYRQLSRRKRFSARRP